MPLGTSIPLTSALKNLLSLQDNKGRAACPLIGDMPDATETFQKKKVLLRNAQRSRTVFILKDLGQRLARKEARNRLYNLMCSPRKGEKENFLYNPYR